MKKAAKKLDFSNTLEEANYANVVLNGPNFYGELISGRCLDRLSKEKGGDYYEKSFPKELQGKSE